MITIHIGENVRKHTDSGLQQWINEQLSKRRKDKAPVCLQEFAMFIIPIGTTTKTKHFRHFCTLNIQLCTSTNPCCL